MRARRGPGVPLALSVGVLAAVVAATGLRLHGIAFGLPAVNDPDELMFELGAIRMLSARTLNPGWFGHPATTTMDLLAVLDIATFVVGWLTGRFADVPGFVNAVYRSPGVVMIPHRLAMVGFAVGTVALTARLAQRLWDRSDDGGGARRSPAGVVAGVAAATLLALNPVHMVWSQVIRSDIMACLFLLLCILAACDIAERGTGRDWMRCAAWLALATATKWPFALGLLGLAGAAGLRLGAGDPPQKVMKLTVLAAGLTIAFLLAISPYLLLAWPTVLADVTGEAQLQHLGATGGTPWQNVAWYAAGPVWAGLGPVGLGLAAIGLWYSRRTDLVLAILLPIAGGFCIAMCCRRSYGIDGPYR